MTGPRIVEPRNPACATSTHSMWARARLGCICPPSDADRELWREQSRRRKTGRRCVRVGWAADIDPIAVERLVCGESPRRITRAERLAAVAILTERGLSQAQIAHRLSCNARTVVRYRRANRAQMETTSC